MKKIPSLIYDTPAFSFSMQRQSKTGDRIQKLEVVSEKV